MFFATAITYTVMNRYAPSAIGASPTNLCSLQELFNTIFSDKGEIAHKRFYHRIGVDIPTFLIDNLPARILRTSVTESVRQCFPYSQKVAPYVFVIPFILSFAIFWIYPLCSSVFMSFEKITPLKTSFVGIDNYKKLLTDTVFQTAIKNSATYMFWTLVLLIPFPMLFAVLMDSNLVKAKGVWKAVLYMPALTSVVISGTLFRLMFTEYSTGQMNKIVMALGMEPFKWLKVGWTGMAALLVLACWRWTGVNMLYFLSGLKSIDTSLYEAAEIDGANGWQKFRYVTLPLLRPTTIYVFFVNTQ